MKLHHIRDVLAVSRFGSLHAAARHIGVGQSAISRSIQDLEREFDAPLFERYSHGVRLTAIGEAFVRRAAAIESEILRSREEIEQLKGMSTGSVSIAVSIAPSICLMPSALPHFYRRFPDADLHTVETLLPTIENDLLDGKFDAYVGAVDFSAPISPRLMVETLFENEVVVIARKDHPLLKATSITALNDARWVFCGSANLHFGFEFENWFRALNLEPPKTAYRCGSTLQTGLAVSTSDFLASVPRQILELAALGQRISAVPLVPPIPSPPICLVRQRGLHLTPMAEYFCDVIRRVSASYVKRIAADALVATMTANEPITLRPSSAA